MLASGSHHGVIKITYNGLSIFVDIIKNRRELDDSDMDMLERMETLQNMVSPGLG